MGSLVRGRLTMFHHTKSALPSGLHEKSTSPHFVHCALGMKMMDERVYGSLFSMPNPLGMVLPNGHVNRWKASEP